MILYERMTRNGRNYIYAGFGPITKKRYLIKKDRHGNEIIIFNGKKTIISSPFMPFQSKSDIDKINAEVHTRRANYGY